MLGMCRHIFGSGKAVVLDSGFFFDKGNTELESKVVYAAALINRKSYYQKGVPGDLIYIHFENKEVGDVGMIEARTEYYKLFKTICIKNMDLRNEDNGKLDGT